MMGSGKSAVGRALAARSDVPFIDTDLMVELESGRSVAEVFVSEGESGFRLRESSAIEAAASVSHAVVATGGGAILDAGNVRIMKSTGPVVWLQAPPTVLAARIGDASTRPLLANPGSNSPGLNGPDAVQRLSVLLADRQEAYEAAADHIVSTDDVALDEVVKLVEEIWIAS
jgi:shikimate kinase